MTLTTDRFNEIYENPEQCSYSEIQEMAAMLANWEAQPVAYTEQCEISNMQATGLYLRGFPDNSQGRNIPLYTAPPAPAPAVPDDHPHLKNVQELYHKQEERLFELAQRIKGESFDKYSHTMAQAIDVLERAIFGDDGSACRAAMLAAAPEGGMANLTARSKSNQLT